MDLARASPTTPSSDSTRSSRAATGARDLPFGTYAVREVKASEGYLLTEGEALVEIREDGVVVAATHPQRRHEVVRPRLYDGPKVQAAAGGEPLPPGATPPPFGPHCMGRRRRPTVSREAPPRRAGADEGKGRNHVSTKDGREGHGVRGGRLAGAAGGRRGGPGPQGQGPAALGASQAQAARLYSDTPSDAWYVMDGWLGYVTSKGYMSGYAGTTLFGPEDTVTRAQVAAVLMRWAEPADRSTRDPLQYGQVTNFSDVPAGQWYTSAVEWCRAHGVITGDTDSAGNPLGTFRPDDPVTREELAAMLHRAAAAMGAGSGSASLVGYPDALKASPYALEALSWCVANGVLTGDLSTGTPMLNPLSNATRAQLAKMATVLFRDLCSVPSGDSGTGDASQGSTAGSGSQQPSGDDAGSADKPSSGSTSGSGSTGSSGSAATPSQPSSGGSAAGSTSSSGSGTASGSGSTPGTGSSSKPAEKTWHETKPAWDEQVLVKAAWDEQVLVKAAWDEQVLVKEAWDEQVLTVPEWYEQVVVGSHYVFHYDGYKAYSEDDLDAHAWELMQQGIEITSYYVDYDYETVHHPNEYTFVHHDAEYTTVHHDAEYTTVHHDAEYKTVHHDAEGYWA